MGKEEVKIIDGPDKFELLTSLGGGENAHSVNLTLYLPVKQVRMLLTVRIDSLSRADANGEPFCKGENWRFRALKDGKMGPAGWCNGYYNTQSKSGTVVNGFNPSREGLKIG